MGLIIESLFFFKCSLNWGDLRDLVKTQSGGGFGATVSSTRWNKYGTFTAKFKSGSSGPGIVTAFLLSNPALGEEISFEITGKDPKKIITNYYRRVMPHHDDGSHGHGHSGNGHHYQHSHLVPHEESIIIKKDTSAQELVYKIEWTESMIRWSVDGKVLRTVNVKDPTVHSEGGVPENMMQLQLTVWDAGSAQETQSWAGGETDYGEDNMKEYVATVDSVEIKCQDQKEGQKPWPGPEALKRLKNAEAEAATRAKRYQKFNKKQPGGDGGLFSSTAHFFEIAILSLIKWTCLLLALVCGAAYFAEPKAKSTTSRTAASVSSSSSRQNLGLHP